MTSILAPDVRRRDQLGDGAISTAWHSGPSTWTQGPKKPSRSMRGAVCLIDPMVAGLKGQRTALPFYVWCSSLRIHRLVFQFDT